eukprot:COSAG02_NODE_1714_length_11220_cov_3.198543_1_plen_176_part_00
MSKSLALGLVGTVIGPLSEALVLGRPLLDLYLRWERRTGGGHERPPAWSLPWEGAASGAGPAKGAVAGEQAASDMLCCLSLSISLSLSLSVCVCVALWRQPLRDPLPNDTAASAAPPFRTRPPVCQYVPCYRFMRLAGLYYAPLQCTPLDRSAVCSVEGALTAGREGGTSREMRG